MAPPTPVAEIALLIYPDCQLAAVYGLTDLFRVANDWADEGSDSPRRPVRVTHWRASEAEAPVTCVWDSHPGLPHSPTHVIAPPSLIMPDRMQPMTQSAEWMRARHASGSTICSVCAGAFVLTATGLADGRRVTTHWAFASQLAARSPRVDVQAQEIVLDDGDIITAGGIIAWVDLGLTLVERLLGSGVMMMTARFFVVDPPRNSQRPFALFLPTFRHGDPAILKVQHSLHANLGQPVEIAELAGEVGLTERTLLRRFTKATGLAPTAYLRQARIARARERLEMTDESIDRISYAVGYEDPAAFRKAFKTITGLTPGAYRERFGLHR